jgi:hypothetical protein
MCKARVAHKRSDGPIITLPRAFRQRRVQAYLPRGLADYREVGPSGTPRSFSARAEKVGELTVFAAARALGFDRRVEEVMIANDCARNSV